MSDLTFAVFKKAVQQKFEELSKYNLFKTDVGKDELWEFYLNSFPEGTNKVFKERREYDCQSCKQFIRACGNVVAIIDNKPVSIWDVTVDGYYQEVASKMAEMIKSKVIKDAFYHEERDLGTDFNRQLVGDEVITWNHFYYRLPKSFVKKNVAHDIGECKATKEVFKRAMDEITVESAEMVIELIDQNSLYRGEENHAAVDFFLKHKKVYADLPDEKKDYYAWEESMKAGPFARVRNTAIGTLLVDLSEEMELDQAVKSFESKVAPMNYKRPTALITKSMIKNAEKTVEELGISDSLARRYAVPEDITINNVLFANREAKKAMSVFDELAAETKEDVKKFDHVESVDIETFIKNILPKAESIELMLENKHINNLMSLIAPVNKDAKGIFKWGNNFSWAYNNDAADSVKERVRKAGGRIDGVFRCSHSWNELEPNQSLMDGHVFMPGNEHYSDDSCHNLYGNNSRVGWNNRNHYKSGGSQDVDYVNEAPAGYIPVENITFPDLNRMPEGKYIYKIHNWAYRKSGGKGRAEIEFGGTVYEYVYPRTKHKQWITVAEITLKDGIFDIEHKLKPSTVPREVWGIHTQRFHKVSMVMHSPNHWDGEKTGNKHFFFILEGCKNDGRPRGFFNEFLSNELTEHRKVFEVLGSKMKVEESDNQISGIGFSSTVRNEILCKVSGSFSRSIKLKF